MLKMRLERRVGLKKKSELNNLVSGGTQSRRGQPRRFVMNCKLHAPALSRESSRSLSWKRKKKKIRFCLRYKLTIKGRFKIETERRRRESCSLVALASAGMLPWIRGDEPCPTPYRPGAGPQCELCKRHPARVPVGFQIPASSWEGRSRGN